jgi:hypothetical protein
VVFAGSSTIRFWNGLEEDMAPLPTVQRGFGGAKINDVIRYLDRLIARHEPSMVVLYIGSPMRASSFLRPSLLRPTRIERRRSKR